jgi:hypothetical protein
LPLGRTPPGCDPGLDYATAKVQKGTESFFRQKLVYMTIVKGCPNGVSLSLAP